MSKKWIVEPGNDCQPTETNPMAMQNVVLTFAIIAVAFVVSLFILVIELLVSCCFSRYISFYSKSYFVIDNLLNTCTYLYQKKAFYIFIHFFRDHDVANYKAEERMLNNRIINDHRLVSKVFQAKYPYYSRYLNSRGLVDMYNHPTMSRSKWYQNKLTNVLVRLSN